MTRQTIESLACALVLSALIACEDDGAAPTPGVDAGASDAAMRDAGALDAQVDLGPPPRFTDLGNGVVRDDNGSGLFWQQVVSSSTYTHPQATDYCAGLALDGRGWRLPNRDELMSITDAVRRNPAIHPRFFPGTPPVFFWTSSFRTATTSFAWTVDFATGLVGYDAVTSFLAVRCVG